MPFEVVLNSLNFCLRSPIVGVSVVFLIIFTTSLLFSFTNKKKVERALKPNVKNDFTGTVLVVGGGVAGCTVALALAGRGFKVVLIERDMSVQDRIVGELLQPGGIRALERLGLSDCAVDGIDSVEVQGYVILNPDPNSCTTSGTQTVLKYPTRDPNGWLEQFGTIRSATLPTNLTSEPRGRSFHHGRFVQNLRGKVLAHPAIEVIEGTVTKLIEENGRVVGVEYRKREEASQKLNPDEPAVSEKSDQRKLHTRRCSIALIADGIWSNFRKTLSSAEITNVGSFVGLVVDHPPMQSPVPHPLHGHVILADPTPCLIYQISSTETRILVDIQGRMPSIAGGEMRRYMEEKICPQLPACFKAPFLAALETKELKSMPCKFFPAKPSLKVGALLIGDALNMRNPLTGGGMTVAIRDAELFSELLGSGNINFSNWDEVSSAYSCFLVERKKYASTINVLANALHDVFSNTSADENSELIRRACFDYLSLGGAFAAGPIGLLAGLAPQPMILVIHFFMVGFYGIKLVMCDEKSSVVSLNSVLRIYSVLRVAFNIIMPLLRSEDSTFLATSVMSIFGRMIFPPISAENA